MMCQHCGIWLTDESDIPHVEHKTFWDCAKALMTVREIVKHAFVKLGVQRACDNGYHKHHKRETD